MNNQFYGFHAFTSMVKVCMYPHSNIDFKKHYSEQKLISMFCNSFLEKKLPQILSISHWPADLPPSFDGMLSEGLSYSNGYISGHLLIAA